MRRVLIFANDFSLPLSLFSQPFSPWIFAPDFVSMMYVSFLCSLRRVLPLFPAHVIKSIGQGHASRGQGHQGSPGNCNEKQLKEKLTRSPVHPIHSEAPIHAHQQPKMFTEEYKGGGAYMAQRGDRWTSCVRFVEYGYGGGLTVLTLWSAMYFISRQTVNERVKPPRYFWGTVALALTHLQVPIPLAEKILRHPIFGPVLSVECRGSFVFACVFVRVCLCVCVVFDRTR